MTAIANVQLHFGSTPGAAGTNIPAAPINILIGPNSSGKSRFLTELKQLLFAENHGQHLKIIKTVDFNRIGDVSLDDAISEIRIPKPDNQDPEPLWIQTRHGVTETTRERIQAIVEHPSENVIEYCKLFTSTNTLYLNGHSRLQSLGGELSISDIRSPAHNVTHKLFIDDAKRAKIRKILFETFGIHFTIDPTLLGKLVAKMAARAPLNDLEERGIHAEALAYHSSSRDFSEASDGVRAFAGIMAHVIAGDPRIVLIDEPEAFLHPALASKLGHDLSHAAEAAGRQIFAATHSSAFLMGCIQSGTRVNIIRLTYNGGIATSRLLHSEQVLDLMRNPLLRSSNVLTSLFYNHVVVTESDSDRAFYQEINERLLRSDPGHGIPDCLFINAVNKHTVPTIVKPLRAVGIPVAGIVDIDVLKEGGKVWIKLLSSVEIPSMSHGSLATLRAEIHQAMTESGRDMKKDGGISILESANREAASSLLDQLADYGAFIVPNGELESWLKHLEVTGHSPEWLVSMFKRMGDDPSKDDYIQPAKGDVWEFINRIRQWMLDSNRKGIPC